MNFTPEPIVYIDRETNQFEINKKVFNDLFMQDEVRDLPVAIISIVGGTRTGKSFLLNFFLRYLQRHQKENWIGDDSEPLEGFSWKIGLESVTNGIVFWPHPFIIKRSDGRKIAVLLMDNQGSFDDETDHDKGRQLVLLSTLLASVQISNHKGNIQSDDTVNLSSYSQYFDQILDKTGHKAFQKFLFLIRDWTNDYEHPFGFKGGKGFLESKMGKQKRKFGQNWDNLTKCCSQIDCFLMSPPGDIVTRDPEFKGELDKIDKDFIVCLKELIPALLSPENIILKRHQGTEMKLWEFSRLLGNLAKDLQEFGSVNVHQLTGIDVKTIAENAEKDCYIRFFTQLCDHDYLNKPKDELKEIFDQAESIVLGLFTEKTKYFESDPIVGNHQIKLIKFFASVRDNYETNEDKKWFSRMRDALNATKTSFENIDPNKVRAWIGVGITLAGIVAKVVVLKRP